jgi:hypothetical protein
LEIQLPFGELAAAALLEGVRLDRGRLDGAATWRPAVVRWALPLGSALSVGAFFDGPMVTLREGVFPVSVSRWMQEEESGKRKRRGSTGGRAGSRRRP